MLFIVDQRAGWNVDDQILAGSTGHFFAHADLARRRPPMVPAGEIEKRVFVGVREENDTAAIATVAAVGSALGDEFFAAKRDAAAPTVAGFDRNRGFIDKHGGDNLELACAAEAKMQSPRLAVGFRGRSLRCCGDSRSGHFVPSSALL